MTNKEKIEMYMDDISRICPDKVLLTKKELAKIRNTSQSTINRELRDGNGIPYVEVRGRIMFSIRDVAEWLLHNTVKANS